jgi:uncharacterized protein YbaA (DUF1428 family)
MPTGNAVSKVTITADNLTQKAFEEVKKSLSALNESARSFTETLKTGLEALGLDLTISAFKEMVTQTVESAASFGLLAEKTGISAKELSGFDYAAQQMGVSTDSLQTGLKLLSKNLVDASTGVRLSADAFKSIGVSTKDASGNIRPMGDVLLDIADKFSKSEDGAGKARIALQLFGRSGTDMIPFLNQGRAGIEQLTAKAEALGITIDGNVAEAMHHFEQQLKTMSAQADAAKLALVSGMLPAMEQVIQSFSVGRDKVDAFNQVGKVLGDVLKTGAAVAYTFAYAFDVAILKVESFYESIKSKLNSNLLAGLATGNANQIAIGLSVKAPDSEDIKAQATALYEQYQKELQSLFTAPEETKNRTASGAPIVPINSANAEQEAAAKLRLIGVSEELAKAEGDTSQEIIDHYSKMIEEVKKIAEKYPALWKQAYAIVDRLTVEEGQKLNHLPIILEDALNKAASAFLKANVLGVPVESVRTIQQLGEQIQATFRAITQEEKAVTDQGKAWGASQFVIDQQLKPLREKEIKDLQAVVDLYQTLAKGAKGADAQVLIEQAKKYEAELDQLKTKAQSFGQILQKDFYQQGLAAFQGIVTQTKSVSDAFRQMALAIVQDIEKMITEWLFFKAISGIMSFAAGPAPSVASVNSAGLGSLSSMHFPGFASGGDFSAGSPMIVGENGPELMVPSSAGSIVPNSKLGGNTYYINAQNAQPGVERDIMRAIKASEDRAVVRSVRTLDSRAKRRG